MAHYQRVYGKITQPSDKLAVIDSELETYGAAEADALDFAGFSKWQFQSEKNMSILKQSYGIGLQPSEGEFGRAPVYDTIYNCICSGLLKSPVDCQS